MKSRFSTVDIGVIVSELRRFLGMRVVNVYDIDNKTYLIRIAKPDEKAVILLESGTRLHSTGFDWPKNPAPSGFSMKMRKHLKGRRFEKIDQLGVDRIVDMQFGSGEAAYHVILELYDRGNIVLTDNNYIILNILRPRTDNSQDVRFAVREQYPIASAKHHEVPTEEKLMQILQMCKEGDPVKRAFITHLDYGPSVLEHCMLTAGLSDNVKVGKDFNIATDMSKLMTMIQTAESLMTTLLSQPCKGFIIQRIDKKPNPKDGETAELATYDEFHPFLFKQLEKKSYLEMDSFDRLNLDINKLAEISCRNGLFKMKDSKSVNFDQAVDEFFSKLESQKLDVKILQQEKAAMKKLENVKKDHEKRVNELQHEQELDIVRGQLLEMNLGLVDQAILVVRSALANQIDWTDIHQIVKEAQSNGDPVAKAIVGLKLDTNHITLHLRDPFDGEETENENKHVPVKPLKIDVDLALSAYANSRKYFEKKKHAAMKEKKTLEASQKALKSAEKKTKEVLKDVAVAASINKTRKTYWFEKFLWFISSENYLVIGGRDQQQNELVVKRHLKPGDLYVHADLHGASSVVIKNPTGEPVPPKTLNEAGTMAICNSAAWDAKVVTSAWWVYPDQVSKTAPSGEYLTTGSFMIRGKKNYLPPSYLIYGFGFLFKLEDGSIERHLGERKVRTIDDDNASTTDTLTSAAESDFILDDVEEEDDSEDGLSDNDEKDSNHDDSNSVNFSQQDKENGADSDHSEESMVQEKDEKSPREWKQRAGGGDVEHPKMASLIEYPDTSISLQHVKGDKYELQRGTSTASTGSGTSATEDPVIFLGDDKPVVFGEKGAHRGVGRLSAKQRREMKKGKKQNTESHESNLETDVNSVTWSSEEKSCMQECEHTTSERENDNQEMMESESKQKGHQQPQQLKRGQKNKLRKIKEKYGDQDEEERRLRMEILASSGPPKEDKKKKGKKGKDTFPTKTAKPSNRPQSGKVTGQGLQNVKINDIIIIAGSQDTETCNLTKPAGFIKEEHLSDEEHETVEEENQQASDTQILNSLTGQPNQEDEVLYAIPVCAPYNALTNYKFKVKLLPGTTKRGKAAKTALNMFQHDKAASTREKDLLRIMKDTDISRNMPGKVKVAAPHLHKR